MRRVAAVLVLSLAVTAGACGDIGTRPTQSLAGTWSLQTVNGSGLPFLVGTSASGTDSLQVLGDVITASGAGTFTDVTIVRSTVSGQVTTDSIPDAGTYTLIGSSASLRFASDGSTISGQLSGNTLSLSSGNGVLVYKR